MWELAVQTECIYIWSRGKKIQRNCQNVIFTLEHIKTTKTHSISNWHPDFHIYSIKTIVWLWKRFEILKMGFLNLKLKPVNWQLAIMHIRGGCIQNTALQSFIMFCESFVSKQWHEVCPSTYHVISVNKALLCNNYFKI